MTLNTKIQCRNDSLFNWELNKEYIPLRGEICFYNDKINLQKRNQNGETIFLPDFKIGDGSSTIEKLPFFGEETLNNLVISPEKTSFIAPFFTEYTNRLPLSTDVNGAVYNGQGWKVNTRLNSSGEAVEFDDIETTGFIPIKSGDTIRFANITCDYTENSAYKQQQYLAFYDSSKTLLFSTLVNGYSNLFGDPTGYYGEADENNNIIKLYLGDAMAQIFTDKNLDIASAAYFRISCEEISNSSIITVNEEITQNIQGFSLSPEIHVPMAVSNQKRLTALEQKFPISSNPSADSTVPTYVILEAEDVIQRVISAQGSRTFTFAALTDLHYGNGGYTDGILHASQALNYIDSRIKLDAVMVLGDYTDDDDDNADFRAVNNLLNNVRFAPNLRQQGNHDFNGETNPVVFRHIQAYSDDVAWGDRIRGYYYKDFNDYKLRVISVNTTDVSDGAGLELSASQINWFIESLDMTNKSDSEEWQILIISHHPLDWWSNNDNSLVVTYILDAYQKGTSWTNGTYSCDYTDKNKAKLIGNIHGHIHNLLADYLRLGNANSTTNTEIWRIATPEGCIHRANQYGGVYADAVTYDKTINTAKDTAFCIYCIDLDTYTINAICYGAGYDRQITYYISETDTYYSVTNNLTNATTTNNATIVIENGKYSAKYYPSDGYEITSATVTIGGVDVTETYYTGGTKLGSLEIADVTGDVVITIVATAIEAEPTYTNQIPLSINADGTLYNGGKGWKTGYRLNSSGAETEATDIEVVGFIPFTLGDVAYFENMTLIIGNSAAQASNQYIAFYDENFAKIATTKFTDAMLQSEKTTYTADESGNLTSFALDYGIFNYMGFKDQSGNARYFRISAEEINDNSIITLNKPINPDGNNQTNKINTLTASVDSSGNPYNDGQGWKANTRLNSSGTETALDGWEVTGFIPINPASAKVYFTNIDWNSTGENKDYLALYDSSFTKLTSTPFISEWIAMGNGAELLASGDIVQDSNGNVTYINFAEFSQVGFGSVKVVDWPNVAYFRISACGIDSNSIITVDEEIV